MKSGIFDKIITVILTLVCIVLAAAIIMQKSGNASSGPSARPQTSTASTEANVNAITAVSGEFIKTSKLSGEVSSSNIDIAQFSAIAGTVIDILVSRGDDVKQGDILMYVDPSKPGMTYKPSAVTATADGIIYDVSVERGSYVSTNTTLATIRGKRSLKIDINVSEKNIGSLEMGASAVVRSVAYPGETWNAEVSYISDTLDSQSRSLPVELTIIGDDSKLKEGMYVSVDLTVLKLDDVIAVPSEAVSRYAGNTIVYKVVDNKAVRTVVETAQSNSEQTVIASGVEDGDIIITAGNVTDGTPVSIV